MKRLLLLPLYLLPIAAHAELQTVHGEGCYTLEAGQSINDGRALAHTLALRSAIESFAVVVSSQSKVENFVLNQDTVDTLSAAQLQEIRILSVETRDGAVCERIQAKLDGAAVLAELKRMQARREAEARIERQGQARAQLAQAGIGFDEATFLGAAQQGDTATLDLLLLAGMNPEATDPKGRTALVLAIKGGRSEATLRLLDGGGDPNHGDRYGWTPLMWAATSKQPDLIAALLTAGAHADETNLGGATALMLAAAAGDEAGVALLLKAGADPAKTNKVGSSALDAARANGHEGVVGLLEGASAH